MFSAVTTAYLEEPPFLQDMMGRLDGPTVVVGMFASDGLHAGEDLPEAMEESLRVPGTLYRRDRRPSKNQRHCLPCSSRLCRGR